MAPLVEETEQGLYCRRGGFHIDPWQGVERAVITHAHSDHARWGSRHYLCAESGQHVLRARLGEDISLQTLAYGEKIVIGGVTVSLHPAGHVLGSAQVRIEANGDVWVITGDYKTQPDRTCEPFELVPCRTLVTESTFGLPIYRWRPQQEVMDQINRWWRENQERGWTSVLYAYALGKAQRLLGGIDPTIGPILLHGSIPKLNAAYAAAGIQLPPAQHATAELAREHQGRALLIAPPSAAGTPWLKKFAPYSDAMASGWMQIRGTRRRRAMDRGFVLSDHADWTGLLATISASGAERIGVTHGYAGVMARWLQEQDHEAWVLHTHFTGELEQEAAEMTEAKDVGETSE